MNQPIERSKFEKTCDEKFKKTSSMSLLTAAQCGDLNALAYRLDQREHSEDCAMAKAAETVHDDDTSALHGNKIDILGQTLVSGRERGCGYTPLHMAAQNGHGHIVLHLLEKGFHPDTGKESRQGYTRIGEEFVTPLHRACFSGAVSCIDALLQYPCDLFAKDRSIGDDMTPLHKAVKGGRHLAVLSLLNHAKNHSKNHNHSTQESTVTAEGNNEQMDQLLNRMFEARDSKNRTPLKLAIELNDISDKDSVRRWDEVAGCAANWQECVNLLSSASLNIAKANENTTLPSITTSTNASVKSTMDRIEESSNKLASEISSPTQTVGQACSLCGKHTLSLFRFTSKSQSKLACRTCFRQYKKKGKV